MGFDSPQADSQATRLTVRRGVYRGQLLIGGFLAAFGALWSCSGHELAPLVMILAAIACAQMGLAWLALSGPRTFAIADDGVRYDRDMENSVLPFAQGMAVRGVDRRRFRDLTVISGRRALHLPRFVHGDRCAFVAALMAGIQRVLPETYGAGDAQLARRGLVLPGALAEVRDRALSAPGSASALVFTSGPIFSGRQRTWLRWFAGALCCLSLAALGAPTADARPFFVGAASFGGVILLIGWLMPRRIARWLLIHDQGLALVDPLLSGELSWQEVVALEGVGVGFLRSKLAREGDRAPMVRIRTIDQATILMVDAFDAPLACIVAAIRERMRQAQATEDSAPPVVMSSPGVGAIPSGP